MHAIALSWQVYEVTGSVALLGLLGLVRAISLMTVSLAGGAIADSVNRRQLLIGTNLILLALSGGLALATTAGTVSVPLLFTVAAMVAAVSSFDGPARQALIPTLVPRRRIPDAMSVNILTGNVADMFGPALGGFAIAFIGISGAYTIDAVSFLAVVLALLLMEQRDAARVRISRGSIAMVAEGIRFVRQTPVIYGVMLLDFLATILGATIASDAGIRRCHLRCWPARARLVELCACYWSSGRRGGNERRTSTEPPRTIDPRRNSVLWDIPGALWAVSEHLAGDALSGRLWRF